MGNLSAPRNRPYKGAYSPFCPWFTKGYGIWRRYRILHYGVVSRRARNTWHRNTHFRACLVLPRTLFMTCHLNGELHLAHLLSKPEPIQRNYRGQGQANPSCCRPGHVFLLYTCQGRNCISRSGNSVLWLRPLHNCHVHVPCMYRAGSVELLCPQRCLSPMAALPRRSPHGWDLRAHLQVPL